MKNKQNLFKFNSEKYIYEVLDRLFDHPGVLLFRGRELAVINEYFIEYPVEIDRFILDLGCGEGCIGSMLFNKIDVGLDILIKDAKKAKKVPVYKNIINANAETMPFKNESFDIVFSNSVIEHIENIDGILEEVSRVLKKQGLFIFSVPTCKFSNYLYFTSLLEKIHLGFIGKIYSKARNRQLNHFNLFDDLEWGERLKKVSLNVIYEKYYLSHKDIYEWDKICILLRSVKPLYFIYRVLAYKFYKEVKQLLLKKGVFSIGGGLLIIAKKSEKT